MDTSYVLLILIILSIPAMVILLPRWMRWKERQRILDTVLQAAEKGISLPESVIQSLIRAAAGGTLASSTTDPVRDMRRGVFLAMIGLAIAVLGLAVFVVFYEDGGPAGVLVSAIGAIPFCIGVGYITVARMGERARKNIVE